MTKPVKNPNDLSLLKELTTQPKRRTIRDIDDPQSYLFPDLTAQEWVEGLKNGTSYYPDVDTAASEFIDEAVRGELNISPREWENIMKQAHKNWKQNPEGTNGKHAPYEIKMNPSLLQEFDAWDKGGRKPELSPRWNLSDLYNDTNWKNHYRPENQWGKSQQINARDEWKWKWMQKGLHDNFNPYVSGYDTAYKSWSDFLSGPYGMFADPKYKNILSWLESNKDYISNDELMSYMEDD